VLGLFVLRAGMKSIAACLEKCTIPHIQGKGRHGCRRICKAPGRNVQEQRAPWAISRGDLPLMRQHLTRRPSGVTHVVMLFGPDFFAPV
jgi:hypothetical protein